MAWWILAWLAAALVAGRTTQPWLGPLAGVALGAGAALRQTGTWRRLIVAGGFPALLLVLTLAQHWRAPAWLWLAPVAALLLLYPWRHWRDAPLFPTPAGALRGLARLAPLRPDRAGRAPQVLDAGCGLGAGLRELRREYPRAELTGIEGSAPLAALCRRRCPGVRVRRGDFWLEDWARYDLVYLFQRPETMPRAVAKARAQMRPGSWLVSLEFPAPDLEPQALLDGEGGRRAWVYRLPFRPGPRA